MFKILRLKFGRSTIFYYLCTGFENEAERTKQQPYRRGLHSGKRYDDDGRLLQFGDRCNTTIGRMLSRARNKLHGSAGEI